MVSLRPQQLHDVLGRMEAVRTFAALPEAGGTGRRQQAHHEHPAQDRRSHRHGRRGAVPRKTPRGALHAAIERVRPGAEAAFAGGDFTGALRDLAQLRDAVDRFFNDVMVMAEDARLRANRLALLATLHTLANRVADISKLAASTEPCDATVPAPLCDPRPRRRGQPRQRPLHQDAR